ISTRRPFVAKAEATTRLPRHLSRKKTGQSGGEIDSEFAADTLFNFERRAAIVLRKLKYGLSSFVPFGNQYCWNMTPSQARTSEPIPRIDEYDFRAVLYAAPREGIQASNNVVNSLETKEMGLHDVFHDHLAASRCVNNVAQALDKQD